MLSIESRPSRPSPRSYFRDDSKLCECGAPAIGQINKPQRCSPLVCFPPTLLACFFSDAMASELDRFARTIFSFVTFLHSTHLHAS